MTEASPLRNSPTQWSEAFRAAFTSQGMLFLLFCGGFMGVFYGKALLSIYAAVLFGIVLINLVLDRNVFAKLSEYRAFIALICILLVYVASGMHSDDLGRWQKITWENVPYAAIPLGFYVFRNVPTSTWPRLLYIYIGICCVSAACVMFDYLLHFEEYNALYKIGKTIPTPIIHVRYSFFMALAACMSFALAYEQHNWQHRVERTEISSASPQLMDSSLSKSTWMSPRRALFFSGLFLTLVVHVLAVRTGMIALYGGLFTMLVFVILRDGKWKLGISTVVGIFLLFAIAYNTLPSVSNKIGYVLYDLQMLKEHGAKAEYSDNMRITSIQHGLALLQENMITGTGIGDLKAEMHRMYNERTPAFPEENRFPPISQYVFTLTAFGLAGALVFYLLLLYPLFSTPFHYVTLAIYATTLFSSVGETTIELQHGKMVFVTLVCIAVFHAMHMSTHAKP